MQNPEPWGLDKVVDEYVCANIIREASFTSCDKFTSLSPSIRWEMLESLKARFNNLFYKTIQTLRHALS